MLHWGTVLGHTHLEDPIRECPCFHPQALRSLGAQLRPTGVRLVPVRDPVLGQAQGLAQVPAWDRGWEE